MIVGQKILEAPRFSLTAIKQTTDCDQPAIPKVHAAEPSPPRPTRLEAKLSLRQSEGQGKEKGSRPTKEF